MGPGMFSGLQRAIVTLCTICVFVGLLLGCLLGYLLFRA